MIREKIVNWLVNKYPTDLYLDTFVRLLRVHNLNLKIKPLGDPSEGPIIIFDGKIRPNKKDPSRSL